MTIALGCVYILAMLVFAVAFLIEWIRNYRKIHKYLKYGLIAGLIVFGLNVGAVVLAPAVPSQGLVFILIIDVFVFLRVVGFTMLGMHYCALLGTPSVLLARRLFAVPDDPDTGPLAPDVEAKGATEDREAWEDVGEPSAEAEPESQSQLPAEPVPAPELPVAPWDGRSCVLHVALVVVVSTVYSIILFKLTSPRMATMAREVLGVGREALSSGGMVTLPALLMLLAFAFGEEIFFRLGIQNFLAQRLGWRGNKYWLAIVATTFLWTLGHAGTLEPGWVKFAQIFPLGLLLGWLFKKHGLESAICAHGLFNCLLAFPGLDLVR